MNEPINQNFPQITKSDLMEDPQKSIGAIVDYIMDQCIYEQEFVTHTVLVSDSLKYLKQFELDDDERVNIYTIVSNLCDQRIRRMDSTSIRVLITNEPVITALMLQINQGLIDKNKFIKTLTSVDEHKDLTISISKELRNKYHIKKDLPKSLIDGYMEALGLLKLYHFEDWTYLSNDTEIELMLIDLEILDDESNGFASFAKNFRESPFFTLQVLEVWEKLLKQSNYSPKKIQEYKQALVTYCATH